MKPTSIPSNMQYLFENADHVLSQEDFDLLIQKHDRAQNLAKNNGAIYRYPKVLKCNNNL